MATPSVFMPLKGHCTCKTLTYEVLAPFIVIQACHCTWCQRETGSAFVVNGIIETAHFRLTSSAATAPLYTHTPSLSGRGQMMARCPNCHIVIYGDYDGEAEWTTFVRVCTLDEESKKRARPEFHIFTESKLEWVELSGERERGVIVMEKRYSRREMWSEERNQRYDRLLEVEREGKARKAEEEEKKKES